MMGLLLIVLFVTTDIYEKAKIRRNNEKTDMTLVYGECNKNSSAVARLCKQ
jgi:hypothetical protein